VTTITGQKYLPRALVWPSAYKMKFSKRLYNQAIYPRPFAMAQPKRQNDAPFPPLTLLQRLWVFPILARLRGLSDICF